MRKHPNNLQRKISFQDVAFLRLVKLALVASAMELRVWSAVPLALSVPFAFVFCICCLLCAAAYHCLFWGGFFKIVFRAPHLERVKGIYFLEILIVHGICDTLERAAA